jgi:hypothetical protein
MASPENYPATINAQICGKRYQEKWSVVSCQLSVKEEAFLSTDH